MSVPDAGGAQADATHVIFELRDPGPPLVAVRLETDLALPSRPLMFDRTPSGWRLRLTRPPVLRMEYRLALEYADGTVETVCDPGNPVRVLTPFGNRSVVEFPGYESPGWLAGPGVAGVLQALPSAHVPGLGAIDMMVWAPARVATDEGLPLLVVHDGSEYARLAALTTFAASLIESERVPAHRVALLDPGAARRDRYAVSDDYADALATVVLPGLCEAVPVVGPLVGLGASLGALSFFHTEWRHPGTFGGLMMQSGSFFNLRFDAHEQARLARFCQVVGFVTEVLESATAPSRPYITMTCGRGEENLANNELFADRLRALDYPVEFGQLPDGHNYIGWRDALDPFLSDLLLRVWCTQ